MTELEWLRAEHEKNKSRLDFERDRRAWSRATFRDVGTIGPIVHLRKELDELVAAIASGSHNAIREEASDVGLLYREIVDRLDIKYEDHQLDLQAKHEENKARDWPPAVDGEPCHHQKSHPPFTVERLELGRSETHNCTVYAYHVAARVYCHRYGRKLTLPQAMPYIAEDIDHLIGCLQAAREDALKEFEGGSND